MNRRDFLIRSAGITGLAAIAPVVSQAFEDCPRQNQEAFQLLEHIVDVQRQKRPYASVCSYPRVAWEENEENPCRELQIAPRKTRVFQENPYTTASKIAWLETARQSLTLTYLQGYYFPKIAPSSPTVVNEVLLRIDAEDAYQKKSPFIPSRERSNCAIISESIYNAFGARISEIVALGFEPIMYPKKFIPSTIHAPEFVHVGFRSWLFKAQTSLILHIKAETETTITGCLYPNLSGRYWGLIDFQSEV